MTSLNLEMNPHYQSGSKMYSSDKIAWSLKKAIKGKEAQVDEKHFHCIIVSSYQDNGHKFLKFAHSQSELFQENPIVTWKFCHLFHKVLREGHEAILRDNARLMPMLKQFSTYWKLINHEYAKLVGIYCQLLVTKFVFHFRNLKIPGTLDVTDKLLLECAHDKDDSFFQMAIEMLDYLDWILCLQREVFNSMTSLDPTSHSVQCKLSPLTTCMEDALHLYRNVTKIMYRLHAKLPADFLRGHRERFNSSFVSLKKFYEKLQSTNYWSLSFVRQELPTSPPNFLVYAQSQQSTVIVHKSNNSQAEMRSVQPPIGRREEPLTMPIASSEGQRSQEVSTQAELVSLLLEKQRVIDDQKEEIERLKCQMGHFRRPQ